MEHIVYDVKEAAEYLSCSPKTIYALLAREQLEHFKVGRNYRFTKTMLDKFVATGGSREVV